MRPATYSDEDLEQHLLQRRRDLDENAAEELHKGDAVVVVGKALRLDRSGDNNEYANLRVTATSVAIARRKTTRSEPDNHVPVDDPWPTVSVP
ncbi:hypothetical protein [Stackebrandtia soli]|uniref:hypothetical protein n=1 Tax=Stackebrandtia soli TaxID=1892856 RepID=UPI0039E88526